MDKEQFMGYFEEANTFARIPPAATIFQANGNIDFEETQRFHYMLGQRVEALFVAGTAGGLLGMNGPQAGHIALAARRAYPNKPLFTGVRGRTHEDAIRFIDQINPSENDVLVLTSLAYGANRPVTEKDIGDQAYFEAIFKAFPSNGMFLYDISSFCGDHSIPVDTFHYMAEHHGDQLFGMKITSADHQYIADTARALNGNFLRLQGIAPKSVPSYRGQFETGEQFPAYHGIIPVSCNLFPGLFDKLSGHLASGEFSEATTITNTLLNDVYPMYGQKFSNIGPALAYALGRMGFGEGFHPQSNLMNPDTKGLVDKVLETQEANLLNPLV